MLRNPSPQTKLGGDAPGDGHATRPRPRPTAGLLPATSARPRPAPSSPNTPPLPDRPVPPLPARLTPPLPLPAGQPRSSAHFHPAGRRSVRSAVSRRAGCWTRVTESRYVSKYQVSGTGSGQAVLQPRVLLQFTSCCCCV